MLWKKHEIPIEFRRHSSDNTAKVQARHTSGLRSRCTTPWRWQNETMLKICSTTILASSSEYLPPLLKQVVRLGTHPLYIPIATLNHINLSKSSTVQMLVCIYNVTCSNCKSSPCKIPSKLKNSSLIPPSEAQMISEEPLMQQWAHLQHKRQQH
jgi:hypothetical protein